MLSFMVILLAKGFKTNIQKPVYLNTCHSFEQRTADLVSRFTIEEKQSMMI